MTTLYLTFNEAPSGVYRSQVVGAYDYLRSDFQRPIHLVALMSLRVFASAKRSLREEVPGASVLPMIPKVRNWYTNRFTLRWLIRRYGPVDVIARGVHAANLAMYLRDRGIVRGVCYDGRGASTAEYAEYMFPQRRDAERRIAKLERAAVHESDFRLAISNALVKYWREQYGYSGDLHAVVPCTLNEEDARRPLSTELHRRATRASLGMSERDVVLAYAGSLAGWQSLNELSNILSGWLDQRTDIKVLFLAREHPLIEELRMKYPGRVVRRFVEPSSVQTLLSAADYGLLVREESQTNTVAAPTKFAEYLAAGLEVLISPGIGDYTTFVCEQSCGYVVSALDSGTPPLERRDDVQRHASNELALQYFVRSAYREGYLRLFESFDRCGLTKGSSVWPTLA